MKLKVLRVSLVLAILSLAMCSKREYPYMSDGIITGQDIRMCACCGGWFITIDSTNYLFNSLPTDSGMDLLNETFPVSVKLDWKVTDGACLNNTITILRVRKE